MSIKFLNNQSILGTLSTTGAVTLGGSLTVSGNQYFNGEFIEGDGKEMFRYSDSWLRINEDNDFADGIYCGTSILRTDGQFQVGPSGGKFLVTSAGAVTAKLTLTLNNGQIILGGTGRIQGIDTVTATTDATNKDYVDTAVAGVSSGVTSIATTNGITGGTITSTGTIQVDSTVVRTTGTQSIAGTKTFTSGSTYVNGVLFINEARARTGQQLVLNAGESAGQATGQTAENVYVNAEAGLQVNSSPDNWNSGWAGRTTATINAAGGASDLPGTLTIIGGLTIYGTGRIQGVDTVTSNTDAANKLYVDNAVAAIVTPATPTTITSTIVGETIEVAFNQSSTSNIDYYQVWASDDGADYGIVAQIAPDGFSATMTIVDTSFYTGGTMSYKVYAVKGGVYSSAGTTSKAYTVGALSVTNLSVVNLNTAYYVQYEKPTTRFLDHIEIYMDSETTQAALSRVGATLVYSGQNHSYMQSVSNSNNFHQFWVEVVTS